jgi:hypothetical protein
MPCQPARHCATTNLDHVALGVSSDIAAGSAARKSVLSSAGGDRDQDEKAANENSGAGNS